VAVSDPARVLVVAVKILFDVVMLNITYNIRSPLFIRTFGEIIVVLDMNDVPIVNGVVIVPNIKQAIWLNIKDEVEVALITNFRISPAEIEFTNADNGIKSIPELLGSVPNVK
jgi:hypothetical protein